MKKVIKISIVVVISLVGFSVNLLNAQDTLVLKSNSKFIVEIKDIGAEDVKYINYFDLNGPTLSVKRSEVDYIAHSDGYKQKINVNDSISTNESPTDMYSRGQKDAQKFYTGYRAAGTGTLVVALLSPLVGLIPAVACSSTPPKEQNLEYPDSKLFQKTDYKNGYIKRAKKIKSGKVWTNWGVAFGVNVVLVLMLQSQAAN